MQGSSKRSATYSDTYCMVMTKDKRYSVIKDLTEAKKLKAFSHILDIIPKCVMATDINLHYYKFEKRVNNPGEFTINECRKLATLIGTDYLTIVQLIAADLKIK